MRVRRLAAAGVVTLAGQQLVAAVAIRLANNGAPVDTQVVYFAGMTLFLVPWAALAVPLATSAYPGLAERSATGDDDGFRRGLAPVVVTAVVACLAAAALLAAVAGPMARVFFLHEPAPTVLATRNTILAFAPGLVGYGLVAVLTRALYARGSWKAPTVCVAGGWGLAVVVDVVLAAVLPGGDRGVALAAGHTVGVTVAGLSLLAVVVREVGTGAVAGLARSGGAALAGAILGGAAGAALVPVLGGRSVAALSAVPAVAVGLAAGATVLVTVAAVIMGTARGPMTATLRALRTGDPSREGVEVLGG
jgi:putative peptidoglycan lipid II flippase